jgi:His/Glu/Gln/Arg/opine family amino acid ABC transporter permease subunit
MIANIIKLINKYGYVYVAGLGGTLWISAVTVFFGTILGTVLASMKLSRVKAFNLFVSLYVGVLRGTPILLQLYFFWLALPKMLPFLKLSETTCIIVALVVNAGAYVAEVVRAGIQAVDIGQTEAALSLGMSRYHMMMRIVLPQAVKNILPALGNEFINMIKQSSLASVFFISELTTSYKTVQAATFLSLPSLIISGTIYLAVTFVLSKGVGLLERSLNRNAR